MLLHMAGKILASLKQKPHFLHNDFVLYLGDSTDILNSLPKTTTRVVIAHRLNTIEHADVIYFVNAGTVIKAGSMQEALALLQAGTQSS